MIGRVQIRNFQSLVDLDLELGPLTVILGESNSGKSALLRALRGVASNITGTGVITRGRNTAEISVDVDGPDGRPYRVTLEYSKTKATGWFYTITDLETGASQDYTKLNRGVPEAVTKLLRIAPIKPGITSLNLTDQFDPPFLLKASGADVARVLGELTNVDTIYAAAAQGKKERAKLAATLRTREADLEQVRQRVAAYAQLPAKLKLARQAHDVAAEAQQLSTRITGLRAVIGQLDAAARVLADTPTVPEPPDITPVEAAGAQLTQFKKLLGEWIQAETARAAQAKAALAADAEATALHEQLHRALVDAGQCPTCGQVVR